MPIECPSCSALSARGAPGTAITVCPTCGETLARANGRSLDAALACSVATFLFLVPANLLPLATTSALSSTRTSHIISGVWAMFRDGWGAMGVVIGLFAIVAPFARFGMLIAALGALKLGLRPPWLGRVFRWADALQPYAMTDVFLLALWIAFARLATTLTIRIDAGGYCLVAAGLCTLYTRATLDRVAVWEAIQPSPSAAPEHPIACPSCDFLNASSAEGTLCPRCGQLLLKRKRQSVNRAAALTFASVLLYIPANLFPMATLPISLKLTSYTVFGGVVDLVEAHLIGLATLVFIASFAIPFMKIAGLSWCIWAVVRRSTTSLKLRTRVYRTIDEIGRWSMVDPFVISTFVPLTQFNTATASRAEAAAPAFTAVVVLTVIAARCFDPRLMWDTAR